jgi:hypothetical protein
MLRRKEQVRDAPLNAYTHTPSRALYMNSYGLSYTSFDFKINVTALHLTTGNTATVVTVGVEVRR